MPRIRTIKPEFPQSETIGRLSRDARLLFIQLWTFVDDSGRARAASRALASLLYPYDNDAPSLIEGWLAELEENYCIRRYEAAGKQYLDIPNWLKHQKIDRPSASRFPAFREPSRALDEPSSGDLGPRTLDLGKDLGSRKKETRASARAWPFEQFWAQYPHKIGKHEALKAFEKIQKSGVTTFDGMMLGLMRYAAKTDDRPWCNPATWLNQHRWDDQPAVVNGGSHGSQRQSPSSRAFELADRARQRELEAGIERPDDALGSDRGSGTPARPISK